MQQSLWQQLCSFDNLVSAHKKARKGKSQKPYVQEFERNLEENLRILQTELMLHAYRPQQLETFIIRDPKTRKIGKSAYRDRVIHHALCNVIEPLFERSFLFSSFANRKGKGPLKAVAYFEDLARKASENFTRNCYGLKADIYHYFAEVDHDILLQLLSRKIYDQKILWLIRRIFENRIAPPPS